jgi:hypothetical protein
VTRLLAHARQNLVAYLALFVALGGTSYAALTINGSQIRNRSIDAVKLNPKTIAASIKAWAIVYAGSNSAGAGAASSSVRVSTLGDGESITWLHRRFGQNCMASVTPQLTVSVSRFGAVTVQFSPGAGNLIVRGFGPDKLGRPQAVYVMIVCP